jgi:hypothetical protein
MAAADPRCAMLASMTECAYRLGMAFAAEAERAPDLETKLKWFPLFDRCFFAVRVSTALELRLKQAPAGPREAASDREVLSDRADPPEREDRDRGYTERDRDRESERASFPILIRALDGVVADAAALPGPEPAELPTLRELLAKVKSQPAPVAAAPKRAANLRASLAGSGAATTAAPERRPASNVGEVLAARRATGPPRR